MKLVFLILLGLLTGCVTDSVQYDPVSHTIQAKRTSLFTNIGDLHFSAERQADGSIKAQVDETTIDQTTAAAQALSAAAQLALKAAQP